MEGSSAMAFALDRKVPDFSATATHAEGQIALSQLSGSIVVL
jgi:hypothetical protein